MIHKADAHRPSHQSRAQPNGRRGWCCCCCCNVQTNIILSFRSGAIFSLRLTEIEFSFGNAHTIRLRTSVYVFATPLRDPLVVIIFNLRRQLSGTMWVCLCVLCVHLEQTHRMTHDSPTFIIIRLCQPVHRAFRPVSLHLPPARISEHFVFPVLTMRMTVLGPFYI